MQNKIKPNNLKKFFIGHFIKNATNVHRQAAIGKRTKGLEEKSSIVRKHCSDLLTVFFTDYFFYLPTALSKLKFSKQRTNVRVFLSLPRTNERTNKIRHFFELFVFVDTSGPEKSRFFWDWFFVDLCTFTTDTTGQLNVILVDTIYRVCGA